MSILNAEELAKIHHLAEEGDIMAKALILLVGAPQMLTCVDAAGLVDLGATYTLVTSDGAGEANTVTMPNGSYYGQVKIISFINKVDPGDSLRIRGTLFANDIVMTTLLDSATFVWGPQPFIKSFWWPVNVTGSAVFSFTP